MAITRGRREAAALFFVVFVLGAVLGGVGNHLLAQRVRGEQPAPISAKPSRAQILADCTRELQLTPEEQTQFGAIIDNTHARWQTLYAPLDVQKEQIRQEGRAQLRAMLTPEQQPKFDDLLRRFDEQRRKAGIQ